MPFCNVFMGRPSYIRKTTTKKNFVREMNSQCWNEHKRVKAETCTLGEVGRHVPTLKVDVCHLEIVVRHQTHVVCQTPVPVRTARRQVRGTRDRLLDVCETRLLRREHRQTFDLHLHSSDDHDWNLVLEGAESRAQIPVNTHLFHNTINYRKLSCRINSTHLKKLLKSKVLTSIVWPIMSDK